MSVSLSEEDALEFLRSWKPTSDVYAFIHGQAVLTTSTALSAMFVNARFRRALKLRNFALISTYGAAVFIPAVASSFLHGMMVVKPLLTKQVQCPVCLETRSALIQVMCSVVYPVILSPLACIPFADSYMTTAVPSLVNQPMNVLKLIGKILKPLRQKLLILAVVQVVIGGALAHCELSNIFTVVNKVHLMEEVVSSTVSETKMKSIRESTLHGDLNELVYSETPKRKFVFDID